MRRRPRSERDRRSVKASSACSPPAPPLELTANGRAAALLFAAGKAAGEPIAKYGPFVMNTPAEIQQAIADYRAGQILKRISLEARNHGEYQCLDRLLFTYVA